MAKGQQRGNREVRKPKQVKKAEPAPARDGIDISRVLAQPKNQKR